MNKQPLYKYRTYSARALEMLIRREVFFAPPSSLNDPYDCRINIRYSLAEAIQSAKMLQNYDLQKSLERLQKIEHVYKKMDQDISEMGIFSLSKNGTEVLMWSHYAENHTGFCVGFDLSDRFTTHANNEQIVGAVEVQYTKSNPFGDYFEEIGTSGELPKWEDFWQSLLISGMIAKAYPWNYEEEVRVLRKKPGLVSFTCKELTEVVFGLAMPVHSRETIRNILSSPDWAHVRFKEIYRLNGFTLGLRDVTPLNTPA